MSFFNRTVFYQMHFGPIGPPPPIIPAVTPSNLEWLRPLDTQDITRTLYYQAWAYGNPQSITPTPSNIEWLQPLSYVRQRYVPLVTSPVYALLPQVAVANTVTIDKWLQSLSVPIRGVPTVSSYLFGFVPFNTLQVSVPIPRVDTHDLPPDYYYHDYDYPDDYYDKQRIISEKHIRKEQEEREEIREAIIEAIKKQREEAEIREIKRQKREAEREADRVKFPRDEFFNWKN